MRMIATLILLIPFVGFSQFMRSNKDCREDEIGIFSRTSDKLFFRKDCKYGLQPAIPLIKPDTNYAVSGIGSDENSAIIRSKYESNRKTMIAGLGILAGGVAITIGGAMAGMIGLSQNGLDNNGQPAVTVMIVGASIGVVGIIVSIAGAAGKAKYKKKLDKLSMDIRSDATTTGITVRINL
jgi:hypothetical protein